MDFWVTYIRPNKGTAQRVGSFATHRGHLAGDQVTVLRQHVGHHECGQLRVGVRVDEAVVRQRVAEVASGVVLHQVQEGGLGVVRWGDRWDLVVLVPGSAPAATPAATSSAATTSTLTCVALRGEVHGVSWCKFKSMLLLKRNSCWGFWIYCFISCTDCRLESFQV